MKSYKLSLGYQYIITAKTFNTRRWSSSTGHNLLFHSYHLTHHFLNPLTMTSGEVSFPAVLINCSSIVSHNIFIISCWYYWVGPR
jgi:hypothetical protein